MNAYEELLAELSEELIVVEKLFKSKAKGLCKGNVIGISKTLDSTSEKTCILAEELGHHYTTAGDITDQSKIENRRQEEKARRWAVRRIASLKGFISAYEAGCRSKEELADHLSITEDFLLWSIDYYKKRYGLMTVIDEQYIIYFEPFGIVRMIT